MKKYKLKSLKKGTLFTLKPNDINNVYVKDDYDRDDKKFLCTKFYDINAWRYFKGDTLVYIDTTF